MTDDNHLKHLEFCQSIITRMNHCSFVLKGWSVTLVSAIFVLAAPGHDGSFLIVAYFPVFMFWILDAYYLAQERKYRGLYAKVAAKDGAVQAFSLDAGKCGGTKATWPQCMFSPTILVFHGLMVVVVALVMFRDPIIKFVRGG